MPWSSFRSDGSLKTQPQPSGLGVPSCWAYASSTTSVAQNTTVTVSLPNEAWDTDGIHDNSVNPSRLTCRTPGLYYVQAAASWENNSVHGEFLTRILKNGATVVADDSRDGYYYTKSRVSGVVSLNVGDYLEVQVYQLGVVSATRVADLTGGANTAQGFGMTWLGPLQQNVPQGTLVTSLPSSPVDGQEIRYLADDTAGVVWNLKYRAASASTYKWEQIGGASLLAVPAGSISVTTSHTTWQAFTSGPSITVPRAGDYRVRFGGKLTGQAAGVVSFLLGLSVNGGTPANTCEHTQNTNQFQGANISLSSTITLAASDVLTVRAKAGSAVNFDGAGPWIEVEPVRVS